VYRVVALVVAVSPLHHASRAVLGIALHCIALHWHRRGAAVEKRLSMKMKFY